MTSKHFAVVAVLLISVALTTVHSKNDTSSALYETRLSVDKTVVNPVVKSKVPDASYHVIISYRRSASSAFAKLIKVLLKEHNINAYLDVDEQRDDWKDYLIKSIKKTPNFVFILSEGTLNECIGDKNYNDIVHLEIKTAVDAKRNIIPVFDDFTMPDAKFSPEINEMMRFQGVEWTHAMVEGSMKRLISYLKDVPVKN